MPRERPTLLLVVAIFHFIIGGLGLGTDLCGVVNFAAGGKSLVPMGSPQQAQQQEEATRILESKAPAYKVVQVVTLGLGFVLSIALLAAGFGLLKVQAWGRSLSLGYAVVSLLAKLFTAVYTILFILPSMDEAFRPMIQQNRQVGEMAVTVGKIGAVAGAFVSMIYPIAVLILLGRPSVGEYFRDDRPRGRGPARRRDEEEDEEGDEDEE